MNLKKWSFSTLMLATLVVGEQTTSFADDCGAPRWRFFGKKTTKTNPDCAVTACTPPGCDVPACASTAPAPAPAPAPASPEEPAITAASVQAAAPPVMFAAPPLSGEISGATNSVGIRGFGMTMPEIRLQLPTLHLPSLVRSSRSPEMAVDGGRAPMVNGNPTIFGPLANAGMANFVTQSAAITGSASPRQASPAPAPAPAGAAPAPAGVPPVPAASRCVSSNQVFDSNIGAYDSPNDISEMRRALVAYRMELERVKSALDAATPTPVDRVSEQDIPPSPSAPIRRLSYTQSRASVPLKRSGQSSKPIEPNYLTDDEEYEDEVQPPTRRRTTRTNSAESNSRQFVPANGPSSEPLKMKQSRPTKVAPSSSVENDEFEDDAPELAKNERVRRPLRRK